MSDVRKSKVTKTISRKYVTPVRFEMLDVTVAIEEEITWSSQEERQKKLDGVTRAAIIDFNRTKEAAFKDFNLPVTNGHVYDTGNVSPVGDDNTKSGYDQLN